MLRLRLIDTFLALMLLASLIFMSGCATTTPTPAAPATDVPAAETPEPLATPRLRITNNGPADLRNLTVMFPDSRIFFGEVPSGTTSEYQPAPAGVYNYAAYEFEVNGETVTQPVIDWMGESPRPGQSYTYVLSYDPSRQNMLMIELLEVQADLN